MKIKRPTLIVMTCGFFLLADQFLKWQALHGWREPALLHRFFGWSPFLNPGIAFGLPVPNWLVISLSIPIIGLIFYLSWKMYDGGELRQAWAFALIFTGALSNFIDRVTYQNTVDYLRLFTGVINLADVLIVVGFAMYLIKQENKKARKQNIYEPVSREAEEKD